MGNNASQPSTASVLSPQDLGKIYIPLTMASSTDPLRQKILQLTSPSSSSTSPNNTNIGNTGSSSRPVFLSPDFAASSTAVSSLILPYTVQINDVYDPLVQPLLRTAEQFDPRLIQLSKMYISSTTSFSAEQFWTQYFTTAVRIIQEYNQTNIVMDDNQEEENNSNKKGTPISRSSEEETILLSQIEEVFVYKVPPRPSAAGWKAQEWPGGLDNPFVIGYLRITGHGNAIVITVWKKGSNSTITSPSFSSSNAEGNRNSTSVTSSSSSLTATPNRNYNIAQQPLLQGHTIVLSCKFTINDERGVSFFIEPVLDSSRYFVLRMVSKDNRIGFAGIGFRERHSAFEMKESIAHYIAQYERQHRSLLEISTDTTRSTFTPTDDKKNIQGTPSSSTTNITTDEIPLNSSTSNSNNNTATSQTPTKVPLLVPPPRTSNLPLTKTSNTTTTTTTVTTKSSDLLPVVTTITSAVTDTVKTITEPNNHTNTNEEKQEDDEFGDFVTN